jgi:hypothetical protein
MRRNEELVVDGLKREEDKREITSMVAPKSGSGFRVTLRD